MPNEWPKCLAKRNGKLVDVVVMKYNDGTIWTYLDVGWAYNIPLKNKPKEIAKELEIIAKMLRKVKVNDPTCNGS